MKPITDLDTLELAIAKWSDDDLFGNEPESRLKELRILAHPDANLDDQERAKHLFTQLGVRFDKIGKPIATIRSATTSYNVRRVIGGGEFSTVYWADEAVVKISREPNCNGTVSGEFKRIEKMATALKGSTYARYIPQPIESFEIKQGAIRRVVTTYECRTEHESLEQVRAAYPDGVDPRDFAWMFKRLLEILGAMQRQNAVHGAITPHHVLIKPKDHSLMLIGWSHGTNMNGMIQTVSTKYRHFYPNEVLTKKSVDSRTDLYMAAMCGVYLLGGDYTAPTSVPPRIANLLRACILPALVHRPSDAWAVHDDFDVVLKSLYGPRKFRPFSLPRSTT